MQVQIDLWQLMLAVAALIGAFGTMVWLFGTVLVRQFKTQIDLRFVAIQAEIGTNSKEEVKVGDQMRNFERDFLTFQRDMPIQYVRRDDYIRGQTVIESKLDALYSKLELVQIQGAKRP